jgi:hypothetical protein
VYPVSKIHKQQDKAQQDQLAQIQMMYNVDKMQHSQMQTHNWQIKIDKKLKD